MRSCVAGWGVCVGGGGGGGGKEGEGVRRANFSGVSRGGSSTPLP